MAKQGKDTARMYIPVDGDFLDMMGELWTTSDRPTRGMDLGEVIVHTVRRMSAATYGDGERAYDVIQSILNHTNGYIDLRKDDYDWMIAQMKDKAHRLWASPDAVYLVRHIESVKTMKVPTDVASDERLSEPTK